MNTQVVFGIIGLSLINVFTPICSAAPVKKKSGFADVYSSIEPFDVVMHSNGKSRIKSELNKFHVEAEVNPFTINSGSLKSEVTCTSIIQALYAISANSDKEKIQLLKKRQTHQAKNGILENMQHDKPLDKLGLKLDEVEDVLNSMLDSNPEMKKSLENTKGKYLIAHEYNFTGQGVYDELSFYFELDTTAGKFPKYLWKGQNFIGRALMLIRDTAGAKDHASVVKDIDASTKNSYDRFVHMLTSSGVLKD